MNHFKGEGDGKLGFITEKLPYPLLFCLQKKLMRNKLDEKACVASIFTLNIWGVGCGENVL